MKFSECNEKQKKAWRNVINAIDSIVGGLENDMEDNAEDSEAYKNAEAWLSDHDRLAEAIYNASISNVYESGSVRYGESAEKHIKDIRFCGREWIMERIDRRLRKIGY